MTTAGTSEAAVPHVIVTLALADFEPSAWLVAVTVTAFGDGATVGAVYSAVLASFSAMIPIVGLPPTIPFTAQIAPVAGFPVPERLVVKVCDAPVRTLAAIGAIEMTTLSFKPTVADALTWELAMLTAVTVTIAGAGRIPGAVYKPVAEIVPTLEFPPVVPSTCHTTLMLDMFLTVARNCCVWPR